MSDVAVIACERRHCPTPTFVIEPLFLYSTTDEASGATEQTKRQHFCPLLCYDIRKNRETEGHGICKQSKRWDL